MLLTLASLPAENGVVFRTGEEPITRSALSCAWCVVHSSVTVVVIPGAQGIEAHVYPLLLLFCVVLTLVLQIEGKQVDSLVSTEFISRFQGHFPECDVIGGKGGGLIPGQRT